MLDTATKRRIDTARDILVGKVPDPKSQVEQITIALIYKFMDDMDAEAEEFGGERKFFAGEYARYGWAKLLRGGLGGHEALNIYAEAIAKMPENPGIPSLFRDIFKNAFLPYRDPETLRAFLKIIDEFEYDHSERLAANIRGYDISPDMVRLSLVNLYLHGFNDPHIHEYDTLTSQDRWNEFADVILANPPFMSPKGGIKPHNRFSVQSKRSEVLFVDYIAEHLTPGGRAGIIVPEGIIFQSQTAYKKLRKLLVEESLVAVVSLPAGVFQPYSGVKTSILLLDKSLAKQSDAIAFFKVENDGFGLGAQRRPIDKNDLPQVLADAKAWFQTLRTATNPAKPAKSSPPPKSTEPSPPSKSIKPSPSSKSTEPSPSSKSTEPSPSSKSIESIPSTALVVPKARIAENGDYNLSGERYREVVATESEWPFVAVREIFQKSNKTVSPDSLIGEVCYVGLENISQNSGNLTGETTVEDPSTIKSLKNVFLPNDILYGKLRPNLNKVWLADREGICSTDIFVIRGLGESVLPALYAHLFRSKRFNNAVMAELKGAQLPRVGWNSFADIPIPLPPLEVQREIVAEIEGYRKVIDGARAVLDHYRPHIPVQPDWPMVELGEVLESKPKNGYSGKPVDRVTDLKVLTLSATTTGTLDLSKFKYLDEDIPQNATCRCRCGDIYLQRGNTAELVGTAALFDRNEPNIVYPDLMIRVRANESKISTHYLLFTLQSPPVRSFITRNAVGAAGSMPKINQGIVERIPVPLPPLETQRAIVAEIEAEQALVNANRDLIARMETKIQATLARVWGEEGKDEGGEMRDEVEKAEKPETRELMVAEAAAGYGRKSTTG